MWFSNALIGIGVLLLLATGGVYGYSYFQELNAQREVAALAPDVPTAWTPVVQPTALPSATAAPTVVPTGTAEPVAIVGLPTLEATPTDLPATATPEPTATPIPILPAIRIVASPI